MDKLNDDMMNNIKNMVDNGNISEAISQISPEMIQNFSNMLNSSGAFNSSNNNGNSNNYNNSNSFNNSNTNSTVNNSSNFGTNNNFNIDMNTIMKMKSVMEKMNNKNDPRANLLYSLKPYLRESKQEKVDQYVNLLNMTKIADIMKNDKKENDSNG